MKMGVISSPINFLGDPNLARASVIAANVWRGIPLRGNFPAGGPADHPASLQEAASLDESDQLAAFPLCDAANADPDHRRRHDLFVLFTFTDFQLIYVLTKGGP